MPKDPNSRTQRKAVRTSIKGVSVAAVVMVSVLCGLAYFRKDFPILSLSSVTPHSSERDIPRGSILIPSDNGLCRLHAIDNATGHIQDDGLVNCLDAADQDTAVWKSLVDRQKATEIRRSFRHE